MFIALSSNKSTTKRIHIAQSFYIFFHSVMQTNKNRDIVILDETIYGLHADIYGRGLLKIKSDTSRGRARLSCSIA